MAADGQWFLVVSREQQAFATLAFDDARFGASYQKLFDS
jgi:hypothetical protein